MKKGLMIFAAVFVSVFVFSMLAEAATSQEINYQPANSASSTFVVQTLKYEPYPVNAGDWFDLWVKVENTGSDDAKNAEFKLLNDYPFSSNDSVRDYGLVPGTTTAYRNQQLGDKDIQANQVIMKFRVKVADNAPEGTNILKISTTTDKNSGFGVIYSLPIEVAKTKSDFDISMQEITPQGTSFVITNTGENSASAVTITAKTQEGVSYTGPKSEVIGYLDKGDFTIAHLNLIPQKDLKSLMLEIAYTDNSGTRTTVLKNVPVEIPSKLDQICSNNTGSYIKWVYGIVGVFIGVIAVLLLIALDKKLIKK